MSIRAVRPARAVTEDFTFRSLELSADDFRSLASRFGSPLLVIDCEAVRRQYRRLAAALPGVELHYALKPLPHPSVVTTLRDEGASFDLATTGEVNLVKAQGIPPERCIHTHPIKRDCDIREALRFGVTTFVADNPDEIRKFVRYRKRAELLLRVSFRSPDAVCDLSRKFGCEPEAVLELLSVARQHGVRVRGLSFHVGSQSSDPAKHVEAVRACGDLIAAALLAGFPALDTLDIGGGFPVPYQPGVPDIEAFCAPIRESLAGLAPHVRVIAEPGRYIAAPAGTAVGTVMGRAQRDGRWWYYLDDGLYGSYSGQLYDHARYPVEVVRAAPGTRVPPSPEEEMGPSPLSSPSQGEEMGPSPLSSPSQGEEWLPSTLAGPTCDSIDVVAEDIALPRLEIGDLVIGRMMGAYTWASATDFNFFPRARVVALNETPLAGGRVVRLNRTRR